MTDHRPELTRRPWRTLRLAVLARDHHQCQVPTTDGSICGQPATIAGHIIAKTHGGTDTPDNLRAECQAHSSREGHTLAIAQLRARRRGANQPSRDWTR
jgi:5-methylcytosine-specific restriction endonuclease McrA